MKTVTMYETWDGRTFNDLVLAKQHELALDILEVVKNHFRGSYEREVNYEEIAEVISKCLTVGGDGTTVLVSTATLLRGRGESPPAHAPAGIVKE